MTRLCFALALACFAAPCGAKEEKVTLDQVPAAVKATVAKEAGASPVLGIEKQVGKKKVVYQAKWKAGGRKHQAKVAADGALIAVDQEVTLDELPAAVKQAASKEAGAATLVDLEKRQKGGKISYKVEWVAGKDRLKLRLAEDGKVLKKGSEPEKDD